jgi:hypothetical protein
LRLVIRPAQSFDTFHRRLFAAPFGPITKDLTLEHFERGMIDGHRGIVGFADAGNLDDGASGHKHNKPTLSIPLDVFASDDDLNGGTFPPDNFGGFQPIQRRHRDIEEYNIGSMLP